MTRRVLLLVLSMLLSLLVTSALCAPSAQARSWTAFLSPSGNIVCGMSRTAAACEVTVHSWSAPPKPERCAPMAYGDRVDLGRRATWPCYTDSVGNPQGKVLGYGMQERVGYMLCRSLRTGMLCRNELTGHGFKLSRTVARFF